MGNRIIDLPTASVPLIANSLFELSEPPHGTGTSKSVSLQQLTDFLGFTYLEVHVTSAQILALDVTPVVLIPSTFGKTTYVIEAIGKTEAGTLAYSDPDIQIYCTTATIPLFTTSNLLDGTTARQWVFTKYVTPSGVNDQYMVDKDIVLQTIGSVPSNGDFGITVVLFYRKV